MNNFQLILVGMFWCLMWYSLGRKHGFEEALEYKEQKEKENKE